MSTREERTSGILMHITSLPGDFGIGDLGPEARRFADFLQRTGQTYWQILPLNPTSKAAGHSPYSSASAFAGNTLLISPEDLAKEGLVSDTFAKRLTTRPGERIDFAHAEKIKAALLEEAFDNFMAMSANQKKGFLNYCEREKEWLDDFALYTSIKKHFDNEPWYRWPREFRKRDRRALTHFKSVHDLEIEKVKWAQFVFSGQWQRLKRYCNTAGIRLFGDLPFYVSYDSADVWAAPQIFALDNDGNMETVAGVPPDYFNADGQLWGMPVFRWNVLKKLGYDWWIRRIRKNIELYDVLRLDHFRAFAGFWAVPADQKTAKNGKWKKGPGEELFMELRKKFGVLPFIAEDLGDIDDSVHDLRTKFDMPGMKVLQFAFGGDFPHSIYLPHRYEKDFVVYSGTHDNNTTLGWYRKDAGKTEKRNLNSYIGRKINNKEVSEVLIRLAFSSIARTAIIPMQDLLVLNEKARMNSPATTRNNWLWRMAKSAIPQEKELWLAELTTLFGRSKAPAHD
jgi:4-alpha-glucanotransferase